MDNGFAQSRQSLASTLRSSTGLIQVRQLHRELDANDTYLGNLFIEAYGKCGHPELSHQVFDNLSNRNTFSWNLLLSAYSRNGNLGKASEIFAAMAPRSLVAANVMISAHARAGHVADAKNVYDSMSEHNSISWCSMLTAYITRNDLDQAHKFLNNLPERDLTCSNLCLSAYAQQGHFLQAKLFFDEMLQRDIATWNTMLDALGKAGKLASMQRHFECMPGWSAASLTILVTALARHGCLEEARRAFLAWPQLHDLMSWTALLTAFALYGEDETGECEFIFLDKMPLHNHVSWTMMLAAYPRSTHLWRRASHFFHDKMPQHSIAASNTVLGMYVQAGMLEQARALFDQMEQRDVGTWDLLLRAARAEEVDELFHAMPEHTPCSWATRIIAAVRIGHLENALSMLDMLRHDHLESWTMLVKCFSDNGLLATARDIFQTRMPVHDRVSSTVMLLAYVRHGHIGPAKQMLQRLPDRDTESWNCLLNIKVADDDQCWRTFQTMPARDVVSWTTMLTSFVDARRAKEALHLFRCMNLEGERINRVTLVAAIDACAAAAAIADGQSIHYQYAAMDPPDATVRVENALLNMYGRCGSLERARVLFADMDERRDLVSWNTMITLYAQRQSRSNTRAALETFHQMNQRGIDPNDITFTALLCACSRSGWLDTALSLFHSMTTDYGHTASTRHKVCMVDILGRAGRLDDAENTLDQTSLGEHGVAWRTLLAASELHGNATTGARAANQSSTSSCGSPAYVLLSNLLTTS